MAAKPVQVKSLASHQSLKRRVPESAPEAPSEEPSAKIAKVDPVNSTADIDIEEENRVAPAPVAPDQDIVITAAVEESSDSEDDDEALRRELDRLRREREAAKNASSHATSLKADTAGATASATVQRSYDSDVLFRNHRNTKTGAAQYEADERFKALLNDPTACDFHQKFLKRYFK